MRMTKRITLMSVLCFVLANIASSATYSSGGGNKKQDNKTTLALNYKKSPITLQNGFRFRGGLSFSNNSTSKSDCVLNSHTTVRFQKGNNLYVLPYKSKPFYSKFKTPQKEMK
ncbi:MAG TPA: hypothetical protein VFV46_04505 [Lacibacter sp.]|nr:hypothetical protein [Lacibacter sp.]